MENSINIWVVDDHLLFRRGIINLIEQVNPRFEVRGEAGNGEDLINSLGGSDPVPDIVVMDMNMPVLDGFATTARLRVEYPQIRILALTMINDEKSLIRMLKAGVHAYLNKDVEPSELEKAILAIAENGYYYNEYVAGKLVQVLQSPEGEQDVSQQLSDQELRFIQYACSDLPYKIIADKMCLSIKTIDGYRAKVFEKFNINSRVGLVLFALKNNLVSLEKL